MNTPDEPQNEIDRVDGIEAARRNGEHAAAMGRLCLTEDGDEFRSTLDFLNDDGWEIRRTPRDARFEATKGGSNNAG